MSKKDPAILVVDDIELNRAILNELFRQRFDVLEADSGPGALAVLERERTRIQLMILDTVLPGMDGFSVLREMRARGYLPGIPVMLIASGLSPDRAETAIHLGVSDFIERPFNIEIIKNRAFHLLSYENAQEMARKAVEEQTREFQKTNRQTIEALSTLIEFRSGESPLHTRRIALITRMLLTSLVPRCPNYGIRDDSVNEIVCASVLHDIGMIAVPEAIINKPGRLTEDEFEIMTHHTVFGAQVLERIFPNINSNFFIYCRDICQYHHERWDGTGYPEGLSGDAIPIWAQIVAIADVYDALTTERIYKTPFSHREALAKIKAGEGGQFNPLLVSLMNDIDEKLDEELDELADGEDILTIPCGIEPDRLLPRTLNLIEHEREQYKALASLSGEILVDYDAASDTMSFSDEYKNHFDGDPIITCAMAEDFIGRYTYQQDQEALMEGFRNTSHRQPTMKMELRLLTKRGWYEWYELVLKTIWSDSATSQCTRALGKLTNIDKTVRENFRLKQQATRDLLTGLLNRVEVERVIRQRIANCKDPAQGALLYLDVDDFKGINDTRGHAYGDEVLRMIGRAIRANIRETDVVGRLGGDEFIIYLDRVRSEEGIINNIERLIHVLRQGLNIRSELTSISVSVGISQFPQDGARYETLLERADQAMYTAKYGGKGVYAFYSSGHVVTNADSTITPAAALEHRDGA